MRASVDCPSLSLLRRLRPARRPAGQVGLRPI